jgi:hypothetical protein
MPERTEPFFYSTDRLELTGVETGRKLFGTEVRMGYFAEFGDDGYVGHFELAYSARLARVCLESLRMLPSMQDQGFEQEMYRAIPLLPRPSGLLVYRGSSVGQPY